MSSTNSSNSTTQTLSPRLPTSIPWVDCFYQEGLKYNITWICANLTVPIDYLNATSNATTTIGIARGRPNGLINPIGALFANRGGPSGAMIMLNVKTGAQGYLRATARQYDIVLVDPRGTGWSQHLTCGYDSQTFKAYDNATFSLLGDVELRGNPIATGNLEQMVDILGMQTGIPCSEYEDQNYLAHTNTPNVVRDMDLIHTLMNYTTFNFWGFSYGTIIGAMYAQMYPQKVGRMILDGVADYTAWTSPINNAIDGEYSSHSEIPRILSEFAEECVQAAQNDTKYCPLAAPSLNASDPNSDLISRLNNLFANLTINAYPDPQSNRPIALFTLLNFVRAGLMATETFPDLAKYMLHAEQTIAAASSSAVQDAIQFPGNPTVLTPSEPANGAPSLPFRLPYLPSPGQLVNLPKRAVLGRRDTPPAISTVGWNPNDPLVGSLNELVFPAVTCLDWNFKGIDNSTAFVNAMLPYLNESVIAGYLELTVSRCLSWPNLTNYDVERMSYLDFPTHLNNKVMVVGVTNDPVTPYPSALNTYNMMGPDNAVFLVHDGFGHCTISDPNNCTWGAITSFLVNGTLPENGTVCVSNNTGANNIFIKEFDVPATSGGTSEALKLGLGIGLGVGIPVLLLLIVGGWWLLRRRRRARESGDGTTAPPSVAESKEVSIAGTGAGNNATGGETIN